MCGNAPRRLRGRKTSRLAALLLGLAAVQLVIAPPRPAEAAEKAIWGPLELPGRGSMFVLYRFLGVDTYQTGLNWADVAPTRPARPRDPRDPAYRWPATVDDAVADARRHRIAVALLVMGSPRWANGGRPPPWAPSPRAFADFLAAAARRYRYVRRWMIWGEVNSSNTFRPNRPGSSVGPRTYARILDAAYVALKRVSRRNIVIGGMTHTGGTVRPAHFLKLLTLRSGRRPRLDWYGHNPFPIGAPNLRKKPVRGGFRDISDIDTFTEEVERAYTRPCGEGASRRCGRRPKLWLSEFVVQSDHPSRIFALSVSRARQARWLREAYEIADRLPSVAGLGWMSLVDQAPARRSANWGLLTAAGEAKPALTAFWKAPGRSFRPGVDRPRVRGRGGARRVIVRVRPRARGPVAIALRSPGGRRVRRARRVLGAGVLWRARIVLGRLPPGRYALVVDAPRGERVIRALRLR